MFFKAYLKNDIDYSMLYKLNKIISNLYSIHIEYIYKLENIDNECQIGRSILSDHDLLNEFVNINLLRIEANMDGNIYHTTNVCKKFIELKLGDT
ncbi:hypothetical protein SPBRAN_1703 [uncultured Candidatus Thioglobus sp.]|nr:hypothetical protein SPBRAN_1703 [uncultured Candidatus Thioglobus sp.]